jgi:hypothetical protein
VGVAEYFVIVLALVFFESEQRVCVVFEWNELVLIELLLLDIVKNDNILILEILANHSFEVRTSNFLYLSWTSR